MSDISCDKFYATICGISAWKCPEPAVHFYHLPGRHPEARCFDHRRSKRMEAYSISHFEYLVRMIMDS